MPYNKLWDLLLGYSRMSLQDKEIIKGNQYIRIGLDALSQAHTYNGDITYSTASLLEYILMFNGYAVIGFNAKGDIVAGLPTMTEDQGIDDDGVITVTGGVTINGNPITNPQIIRNTPSMMNDLTILQSYASKLSKVDFSEDKLVQKSICNPIPMASNDKVYQGIQRALKACGNDDIEVIKFDKTWSRDETSHQDYDLIELTDVANADKFKYISSLHDDIVRRAFFLYGISTVNPTKQAQTNDSELENRDEASKFYVDVRLKTRQEDLQKACDNLGVNITVDFSKILKEMQIKQEGAGANEDTIEGSNEASNDDGQTSDSDN